VLATAASDLVGVYDERFDPWGTCFSCHNEERYKNDEEKFAHTLHFEEEEFEDECTSCHESVFHEKFITDMEGCLECHEPEEIQMPAKEPEA
jgi:acetyl-CoA carboxylase beta subunit